MGAAHTRACRAAVRRLPVARQDVMCHYDAANTDAAGDGGPVATWRDRGNLRMDLTNATSGERPTLRPLGHVGYRSVRGDGVNDRLFNSSQSPFHGRTKASYLVVMSTATNSTTRFIASQAESTAGANGSHVFTDASGARAEWKTDAAVLGGLPVGLSGSGAAVWYSARQPVVAESGLDLTSPSHEHTLTGSGDGFNYGDRAGSTIDSSAGQFCLFAFSSGYSDASAVDIHEVVLLARPMTTGERRRFYRYCQRRWGSSCRPNGYWRDGSITVAL